MQYMFDGKDSESIIWNVPSNNLYNGFVSSRGNLSDPCNDGQQAWEIMLTNDISIRSWCVGLYFSFRTIFFSNGDMEYYNHETVTNEKPLVAAMICFLEI